MSTDFNPEVVSQGLWPTTKSSNFEFYIYH